MKHTISGHWALKYLFQKIHFLVFLIFIFSFIFYNNSYAQTTEMHKGYIITLEQDTLNGIIFFQDRKINPEQVIFLKNGKETIYTSKDIMGFGIPKLLAFKSAKIKYSTNPDEINKLLESKEIIWAEETVFLRTLILGKINLFEYIDSNKKLHFITQKENVYNELLNIKYKKGGKMATISKYKNQLKILMRECLDIFESVNKTKFRKESIKSIIKDFHKCQNQEITFNSKKEKIGLDISLYGGLSITSYTLVSHPVISDGTTNSGPHFTAGMDFEFVLPRNNKTWSIVSGLGYRSYQVEPNKSLFNLDRPLEYLRVNAFLKKIIFNKTFNLGLYVGLNNSFTLNKEHPDMKNEQGFMFGINSQIKNLKFDVRFENGNGYSPFTTINTKVNTLFFQLGYSIFKSKSIQAKSH